MSKNEKETYLKSLISVLPDTPGVYQYYDKLGNIIYVGKAKNLKKRVASYFNKNHEHGKTIVLVKKIADIKHIVVENEEDALLLENNLIKKYQPRYNVLLKDDKTYPWICVKSEPFPRVFQTREIVKDGSLYFGPYSNIRVLRTMLEMLRQLYPIRSCSLNLSQLQIAKGNYKECLEYHIGNCKAPCVGLQQETDYMEYISDIKNILKGNISDVLKLLNQKMTQLATELKFEAAQQIKEKVELLEKYRSKSTVVSPSINNVDVFSLLDDGDVAYANFLKVANGAIIQSHTIELKKRLNESKEELLGIAITEIRQLIESTAIEILVPFLPDFTFNSLRFVIPQRGDKKSLLDLSLRNLKYYRVEKLKQIEHTDPERHTTRILETIKNDLQLDQLPRHIECFDNSNIQGKYPVAACVVFKNAKPSKNDYRHFNIKTVEGPNDFASMEEVVERRYKRLLEEKEDLPNLVIVDGGKGQLSSAVKIFKKLEIFDKVALIGIAKRLEEIFFPNDSIPIYLDKKSETLKVIQHLRNEAHRFGITHHRNKRSNDFIKSELFNISGIGKKTAENLLSNLKSISAVKKASVEDLTKIVGNAKAKIVFDYFNNAR
jgi:excinuclease ABC subunit C